jgi:hypothetical protein
MTHRMKNLKSTILKWFLIISGIIQICYWGISHLFFPQWYLHSVGINGLAENPKDVLIFMNEIGILTIGTGIATILAAFNPVKNAAIIIMLYIVSFGSIFTSLYHILYKGIAGGEWMTVITLLVQLTILTLLYPWKELKK